ncbi:MAG: hypothetical protein Q9174_006067, partial [Haloplaca sp. 1 TL-2023]
MREDPSVEDHTAASSGTWGSPPVNGSSLPLQGPEVASHDDVQSEDNISSFQPHETVSSDPDVSTRSELAHLIPCPRSPDTVGGNLDDMDNDTMSEDSLMLNSDYEDDHDGGVPLTGSEDTMDLDERHCFDDEPSLHSEAVVENVPNQHVSSSEVPIEDAAQVSNHDPIGMINPDPLESAWLDSMFGTESDHSQLEGFDSDTFATQPSHLQDQGFDFDSFLADGFVPHAILQPFIEENEASDHPEDAVSSLTAPDGEAGPVQPAFDDDVLANTFDEFLQTQSIYNEPYPQLLPFYGQSTHNSGNGFFAQHEDRKNMSLLECLRFWRDGHKLQQLKRNKLCSDRVMFPPLTVQGVHHFAKARRRERVDASDLRPQSCDFQGINWGAIGVTREEARLVRRKTYHNHANLLLSYPEAEVFNHWPMLSSSPYVNTEVRSKVKGNGKDKAEKYFRFTRMGMKNRISIAHFQLRHIVSASSKNAVFFPADNGEIQPHHATDSWIRRIDPEAEDYDISIDSAKTVGDTEAPRMQKIFTLSAKHDILVAGGFNGEYAYRPLSLPPCTPFTSGMITRSEWSSTNHVHTFLDRRSGLPQAVFSSNDDAVHILDCTTNKFLAHHHYAKDKPINCAATSPDSRLRLLVRDAKHPIIVEADSGKRIGKLSGHHDFGFACDWADDGRYIATGAQDGLVQIYDMRYWHRSKAPLKTILTELGGVRTLKFSPEAGGKQVLVLAESADFIHVVDGT